MNQPTDFALLHPPVDAGSPVADEWLALSGAQRSIWLDLQLLADPLAYQLVGRARIFGRLRVDAARQATSLLIARNDALRLRIDPHEPRQRLVASSQAPLVVHDLSESGDEAALEACVAQVFATVLPLGDAPLFHVDLIHARPGEWLMLWRIHHAIADAATVAIAMRRWVELYNSLLEESAVELAPATSFVQTLAADRHYRESPQAAADLAYWRARFDTPPEAALHAPP